MTENGAVEVSRVQGPLVEPDIMRPEPRKHACIYTNIRTSSSEEQEESTVEGRSGIVRLHRVFVFKLQHVPTLKQK